MELKNIKELQSKVKIIIDKYEKVRKENGEDFNIFSIMKMESNEVYTHSALIGELLNPNGSHGLSYRPLELFMNQLNSRKEFSVPLNIDYDSVIIEIEKNIGIINEDKTQGGRLDIVIKDKHNVIAIENKINANEQPNQLLRYKNHYKNAPILYLTLNGDDSTTAGNMVVNSDYFLISYKCDIKKWIEDCVNKLNPNPIVKETLNQYLYLIKYLTNQTTNMEMTNEITDVLKEDIQSSFEIAKSIQELKLKIYRDFMNSIKIYSESKNLQFNGDFIEKGNPYGAYLSDEKWNGYSLGILFELDNYQGLYYMLEFDKEISDENKEILKSKFSNYENNDHGIWRYSEKANWGDNADIWELALKKENNFFVNEATSTINEIIKILNTK